MKRLSTILLLVISFSFCAAAQDWGLRSSIDLKYGYQSLKSGDTGKKWGSDASFALAYNIKQIQFHKQPIAGLLYIGLDTGISLDFAKYRTVVDNNYQRGRNLKEGIGSRAILGNWGLMEAEIGVPVGPYVKIAPLADKGNVDLRISAFYHFVPSASALVLDSKYGINFAPFSTVGAIVGYRNINLGYEYRFGMGYTSYNMKSPSDDTSAIEKYKSSTHNIFVRISFGK